MVFTSVIARRKIKRRQIFPWHSLPSSPLSFLPLPLEVWPINPARRPGEGCKLHSKSGRSLAAEGYLLLLGL